MNKNTFTRLCKLVESGINLIIDGYAPDVKFRFAAFLNNNELKELNVIDVTLTPSEGFVYSVEGIVINALGREAVVSVQAENGEDLWTCLNPLSGRVEEAVHVILGG